MLSLLKKNKHIVSKIVQIVVTALCFWYLFYDIDYALLFGAISIYSPLMLFAFLFVFLPFTIAPGIRLNYLTGWRATMPVSMGAVFFGNGVNNLLPAKLGELAKAVYLSRKKGIAATECLCIVFWERLADLNAVLIFSVLIGLFFGVRELYLPLLVGMSIIWVGLLFLFRYPGYFVRMACCLPNGRIRDFSTNIIQNLGQADKRPSWFMLMFLSIVTWLGYIVFTHLFLIYVCGLNIAFSGSALVAIASGMGMILPAMPANLGAFEAAVVAALTLLGVDKAPALGAAFALHIVQIIPFIIFAAKVMLVDNISLLGSSSSSSAGTSPSAEHTANSTKSDIS